MATWGAHSIAPQPSLAPHSSSLITSSLALTRSLLRVWQARPPVKRPLECALEQCALGVPLKAPYYNTHCSTLHWLGA